MNYYGELGTGEAGGMVNPVPKIANLISNAKECTAGEANTRRA